MTVPPIDRRRPPRERPDFERTPKRVKVLYAVIVLLLLALAAVALISVLAPAN